MIDQPTLEEFFFKYRWIFLAVVLGILLILFGVLSFTRQFPWGESKVEILSAESDSGEITVEIAGAVEKPGVYKFNSSNRVEDLLIKAGGLSAQADREWVEKILNRAAKLTDGQKIYIPDKTQSASPSTGWYGASGRTNVKGVETINGLVNINEASRAELEALSGIGPVTAQKIIDNRPYSVVEELITRKVLKQSVYEDNKDKLSVY